MPSRETDPAQLVDPATYENGPPFPLLRQLRSSSPVVWVDEPALHGQPTGPGFWLVLRHAEVERVLRDPATFSSWLGATQIRDAGDLEWVRRMMLNMDPPDHSRLRRLLSRSFTPRAVAALTTAIEATAARLVDRMIDRSTEGRCDFAKDVAADLPLITLADVLGVPAADRWLLFDWSNRVIGWQDPDYATSATFDPSSGTDLARQAVALRPSPDAEGRMPDPRTRAGMPDLYGYARLLAEEKRRSPGTDVMSILLAQGDGDGGRDGETAGGERRRVREPVLAVRRRRERDAAQRPARRADRPARTPRGGRGPARGPVPAARGGRRDAPLVDPGDGLPAYRDHRRRAVRGPDPGRDKVVVSFTSANRDERVFADPDRFDIRRAPNPHLSFGHGPHFCLGAQLARAQMRALFAELLRRTRGLELDGAPALLRSNFQRGVKRLPIRWTAA